MAPSAAAAVDPVREQPGPQPSFITVAKPFVFHQQLQSNLVAIGTNPSREDTFRLSGVQWINDVRTALQL
jgi:CTD kinase subunit beta